MRIFVADDQVLFRDGLVSMLQTQADMTVVGEAGSLHEMIERLPGTRPDLVLIDLMLPNGDGIEGMKVIHSQLPEVKTVILTIYDSDDMLITAFMNGAKGYLLKNTPMSKLLVSLRAVNRGEFALSRAMTGRVIEEFTRLVFAKSHLRNGLNNLTMRELEVLKEIGTGASNKEISERLFIAENTVKIHVHNLYEKLKLRNRREAMNLAQRVGLVKRPLEFPVPNRST